MSRRRTLTVAILIVLLILALFWKMNQPGGLSFLRTANTEQGFDRNETRLIYTRHAKCRMECRHISEAEILQVLKHGEINYEKSDLHAKPDAKWALEGRPGDEHRLRIIFAPTKKGMVVITCIDLDKDWYCDCT